MNPNNILQKINQNRLLQVQQLKKLQSVDVLEDNPTFKVECISLVNQILNTKNAIISEFKKASPSKGIINKDVNVVEVTKGYQHAGAVGISILTEETYFKGNNIDLITARKSLTIPILRKDFIVDAYQIVESKAIGADVILLIAASLSVRQVNDYAAQAKSLGLEVLLEVHEEEELNHICEYVDIVGVNNRSLKTFEVDVQTSLQLLPLIPKNKIPISESGLSSIENLKMLQKAGFKAFLMGEAFMKHQNPAQELKNLMLQF